MLDQTGRAIWAQRILADVRQAPPGVGEGRYGGAIRLNEAGRVELLGGGTQDAYRMTCIPP